MPFILCRAILIFCIGMTLTVVVYRYRLLRLALINLCAWHHILTYIEIGCVIIDYRQRLWRLALRNLEARHELLAGIFYQSRMLRLALRNLGTRHHALACRNGRGYRHCLILAYGNVI